MKLQNYLQRTHISESLAHSICANPAIPPHIQR